MTPDISASLTVGEVIGIMRRRAGLSQLQLAEKANVSRNEISLLECDSTNYTVATLWAVADALGMRAEFRLCKREEKDVTP
jgi:transcriptional regulator with XRE-family HTH domain